MPLLTIKAGSSTEEAHEWILSVFLQILERIVMAEVLADDLTYEVEHLSRADIDTIFEDAIKGLLQ